MRKGGRAKISLVRANGGNPAVLFVWLKFPGQSFIAPWLARAASVGRIRKVFANINTDDVYEN